MRTMPGLFVQSVQRVAAVRLGYDVDPIRAVVVAQTLGVAAAGVACGIPLALGGSDLLRKLVTGVQPVTVAAIIIVAAVLLVAVAVATLGPMVRASRVDVHTALSAE